MPNYTTANLVKAQTRMLEAFQRNELRFRRPVTFDFYRRSTEIMVPSHNEVRTREDRALEVNYFARSARALGTGGRIHNHTGVKGDSAIITPSWTTYDDKFYKSLKQADISIYSDVEQLANEYQNVIANFAEGLENAASDHAFANRTTVDPGAIESTFNAVNDAVEITESSVGTRAVQISKRTLDKNKYQGMPLTFLCDAIAFNKFERDAAQGTSNSTNLSFQYSGVEFIYSEGLDADAAGLSYTAGFWLVVPMGMVSALDWIPMQNRMGVETKVNTYNTILNPVDGITYAQHIYPERVDDSAANGYTQDVKEELQISVDISLNVAPSTTAGTTPIHAFALV